MTKRTEKPSRKMIDENMRSNNQILPEIVRLRVSVIVVNYFSQTLISNIERLVADIPACELVVVDNSGEFLATCQETHVIKPGTNLGFGKACNLGASGSKGELLLFLNPDAVVSHELIGELSRHAPGDGHAIWGPAILDGVNRTATLIRPGRFGLRYRRAYIDKMGTSQKPCDVLYVSGACMMTTALFFSMLGGFCEDIFLYAEDLELCERAARVGARIQMLPDLKVRHAGGQSSTQISARWMRLIRSCRGHYRFLSKNSGRISAAVNALHLASGIRL